MTAVTVAERMTAEEFLARRESDDHRRWELVDGEVVMTEAKALHWTVVMNLLSALDTWSRSVPNGGFAGVPLAIGLDERNVFKPDVLWYSQGRVPGLHDPPPYPIPDLAVEVRSPSTWRYDIGIKKATYERFGLPELWLVDTAADVVLVFRRSRPGAPAFDTALELARAQQLTSPLLPGFALPLADVFPER